MVESHILAMAHYESSFASVEYDQSCDAVVGRLEEFTEGGEFREYMNSIIDTVEDERTGSVLADTSDFDSALTEEDQAWSVREWAPRAEAAGVEELALVMPQAVVAEMSVDAIVEMADDDIDRELFDDVGDAKDWLGSP